MTIKTLLPRGQKKPKGEKTLKEQVNVAVVQMDIAWLNPEENLKKIVRVIKEVGPTGRADLILFPELANTGYVVERDKTFGGSLLEKAETIPGPFTETLGTAAREHGVHLIFGFCELHPTIPGPLYNSEVMIGPDGGIAGVHRKIHIFGEEKHYFAPGNKNDVHKTDLGNIGMLVCYDAIFPEISRVLAVRGAEIICCIFNRAKREPEDMLSHMSFARAYENRVFFVSCNRVGNKPVIYMGRSVVTHPFGKILAEGGPEEEIFYATLDHSALLEERVFFPIYAERRPELYGALTE